MSTNDKLGPGVVLGRYELLLPIAQGGMATVWAARQKGSRGFTKTVAIKTMLPALTDDPQFEQMFLDEAALAARIHHPNVAEILDLGEQNEVLYLVMEWIDGEALSVVHKATRKNQVNLPVRIALKVLGQACAGLHAAHELRDEDAEQPLGLVHRDVSPQNILVTYDGVVKLVDFGVAKAMNRAGGETTAGQLKGKVPYMSPEQARGGKVDRRTDIFAMGIVLYKLTTGTHPFMGDTDLVTMRNIVSRPVLAPRLKNPTFSAELEAVLMKCLQKDVDKRYSTMFELQQALEQTLMAMGGGADDDVGGFVRTLMGERGSKRRLAIRDAVRVADERQAAGTAGVPPPPTVHEHVSDIVVTKMSSGVKEDLLPERSSQAESGSTNLVHTTSPSLLASQPDSPVSLPMNRTRRPAIIAAALAGVIGVLLGVGLLATSSSASRTANASLPEPVAPSASASASAPVAVATALTAAPSATPSAAPSDAPAPTGAAAMSVDDLPNADEKPAQHPSPGAAAHGHAAPHEAAPGASGTAAAGKKAPHVSTQWVPSVQNPGF